MDQIHRLANPQLFASWAGDDFHAWEQAIGTSVTHLSRGSGTVTHVSREMGSIVIHVRYGGAVHEHALWEFRTEVTSMTLPAGVARADLFPAARAQSILQEKARRTAQEARLVLARERRRIG